MDVHEPVACIRIVVVESVEPQNTRCHKILRRRKRIVGPKRNAPDKNSSLRHIVSDLRRHAETAGRRFETPLLRPYTESRRGNRISADSLFAIFHGELLIAN